jgi:hypothetical protein
MVVAVGFAASVALVSLAWELPRRPWSFAILLGGFAAAPLITVIFAGRDLRGLGREIRDKRPSERS